MRIKFFKPSVPKYNKQKLYRLALKEAVSRIVLNNDERSYQTVYNEIMNKAKSKYTQPKKRPPQPPETV